MPKQRLIMKFIIKLFPEITLKSPTVRKRFVRMLADNIRNTLRKIDERVGVVSHWDYLEVRAKQADKLPAVRERLSQISGIHHFLEVEETEFTDLHNIYEQTLARYQDKIINKRFCVRAKRRGEHEFSSMDIMRYVGGGLKQAATGSSVDLTNPEVAIFLEINDNKLQFVTSRYEGLGGFPMGSQESVLSLISGGFDSGVASFLMMRRGIRTHFLFFNMGGTVHELGVKQMAYHLWSNYSQSHKVKFIAVDFEPVVAEILAKIDDGQMGVVLKRLMVQAASRVAQRLSVQAVVTGEAIGQVASQTLTNLQLIDKASDFLILRPLIAHDKETIIKLSEQIGINKIAESMPEFCGVISKSPTVKAVEEKLLKTESQFDFSVLDNALINAKVYDIRELLDNKNDIILPKTVTSTADYDVLIDVRADTDAENKPLMLNDIEVIHIPFYRIHSESSKLDNSKKYLLYCEQGVMSGLQAVELIKKGFEVAIFKQS